MFLSTAAYFLFLSAVFLVYWLVSRFRLAGLAAILFANYFFFARWDLAYLFLIPIASSCDFAIGLGLGAAKSRSARRLLLGCSVLINVALIVSLKYMPFFLGNRGKWVWTLPLGLSFYAFQSLTYTIDIYQGELKPTSSYLAYLTSVSLFPTVLAGPITRVGALLPQLQKSRILDTRDGGRALFLIGIGLMKKLLIADYLGDNLVNRVFDLPKLYSSSEVLLAVYGYAFQLYYDFSGYSDIAIGSALLLGIRLPQNFNRPYLAENIADFWRRWHITLSNWLRDYLYFSLPGLRSRWKVFSYLNLVITMTIGGLWHGANWTFVIWGLLHGLGLASYRWFQNLRGKRTPGSSITARFARRFATFHFVLFAWIFFRAANLGVARDILAQLGSGNVAFSNVSAGFAIVLAIAIVAHYVPPDWYDRALHVFAEAPFFVQAAAMALLVMAIQYVVGSGVAPFIYTKF